MVLYEWELKNRTISAYYWKEKSCWDIRLRKLGELEGNFNLTIQSTIEREIKSLLISVDEQVKKCEQFMVLEKHLDNQT